MSTVKEIPIQIKQEPVERDLQTEPEKTKARYRKSTPAPPVSVVSLLLLPVIMFSLSCNTLKFPECNADTLYSTTFFFFFFFLSYLICLLL